MNIDLWIDNRDNINLAISQLLVEHRSLLKAHTNLHRISKAMRLLLRKLLLLLLDHRLEVHIDLDALQLIIGFPLALELPNLLHFHPSGIPINLDLVDLVSDCDFAGGHVAALGS